MSTAAAAISYDAAMRLAIEHADLVKGSTYPNPPVGAVILDREGRVAGAGGTEPAGSAHAEVVALRRAGSRAAGGTAVVTLEPCNHHGKTPPCVDALLEAGIAGGGCSPMGKPIWWPPARCESGCTSNAPDYRMSRGSTPPASTGAAPRRMA